MSEENAFGLETGNPNTHTLSHGSEFSSNKLRIEPSLIPRHTSLLDVCSWEWDLKANLVCWSDELCNLIGVERRDIPRDLEEYLQFVHPDDHHLIRSDMERVRSGTAYEHEARLVLPGRGLVRVYARAVPIPDRSGEIVSVIGMIRDMTDHTSSSDWLKNVDPLLLVQAEQVADFGSWEYDVKTRHATLSAHLREMLAIDPMSNASAEQYWQRVHPDDREQVLETMRAAIATCKPFEYSCRYVLSDDQVVHHVVRGITVASNGVGAARLAGVVLDVSGQRKVQTELQRLSQDLIRARDEERRNIARDLHESVGQTLAAVKMTLGRLRETLPESNEQAQVLLRSAVDLAADAVREIRTISYLMHPPLLDEAGLASALRWYAKGFAERSGISVQINVSEDFGRHSQELETTVFRIVQEALTNVHRYSGSRTASIRLDRKDGSVVAEVSDDGCGLPAPSSVFGWNGSLGVGILGMRERVNQLKGTFDMESAPGKGTALRVTLPTDFQNGNAGRVEAARTISSVVHSCHGGWPCHQSLTES